MIRVKDMVKEVVVFRPDSIYLCTPTGVELMVDPQVDSLRRIEKIIAGDCRHLAISADGGTLFASISQKGIYCFDPAIGRVKARIDSVRGLSGNEANNLQASDDGILFVGHKTEGMDVVLPAVPNIMFSPAPTGKTVEDIISLSSGEVLLNDGNGHFWKGKAGGDKVITWETIDQDDELRFTPDMAHLCRSEAGGIYALGYKSLVKLSSTGVPVQRDSLSNSLYRGIISTQGDEIVFLRMDKVMIASAGEAPRPLPGLNTDENDYFSTIMKVSADRFLLCYREVELWDVIREGKSWKIRTKHPLPGEMRAAVSVKDKIYVGTSAGLLVLAGNKLSTSFNPVSTNGSLWINALHADITGRLWLGTRQGLFCYKPVENEYLFFGKADGLAGDWFVQANVVDNGPEFIMATKTGLVTINPHLADETVSANNIYLSDIWVNGIQETNHSPYAPKPLELDYLHNSVSFLPGMIELSSSALSGFRYRLEGLEETDAYSKAGEVIRYPSLPPGQYSFRFFGVDKNGRTTEPIYLPITISPPFYKSWWFISLFVSGLLGSFYYLARQAVRKETAKQEAIRKEDARKADENLKRHQAVVAEQRRIMMELHDDLGGTLGSLFYTLDGYLLDKESGLPIEPDFEMLKNASGEAMKQLREVMKNNVAKEMSLAIFIRTLTEQARAVATSSRMEWELEKDSQLPDLQLSSQQVHNALLLSKEALQNIRKHAKATSFTLSISVEEVPANTLTIILTDNGVGVANVNMEYRDDGTGNGLRNMYRRAEDLGGTLTIKNHPDGGTRMKLSFPLN